MREISAETIIETIADMCIEANLHLPKDVENRIRKCREEEKWKTAENILDRIIENFSLDDGIPICQDTGMACVFLKIGQDVHIKGNMKDAVNAGVRKGYTEGFLRKSVVADPIRRINTGDNTPAMIYTELTDGDKIEITLAPKGFGSENMSRLAMLKPSDGIEGVKNFILETVKIAGPNPCPPIVVGVGIGGTFDKCAYMAKYALLRETGIHNADPFYADLENEMLEKINALGIGPQGFGGRTTALAVNVETMPTHIAGLPCGVNINCHVSRHVTRII